MRPEIQSLQEAMERQGYIAEPAIATALFLALEMKKPLLIEGDAGVGKTEVAKVLARLLGTELIRLQCYEGLDVHTALYEWDYPKQMLRVRMAEQEGRSASEIEEVIYCGRTCFRGSVPSPDRAGDCHLVRVWSPAFGRQCFRRAENSDFRS